DVVVRVHVVAGERGDDLVRVHVRRRARAGLEDVDRELVVEVAVRDPVGRRGDALPAVGVQQPELRVHPRRGALDAAEPARHRNRDRLARDGEVVDRLAGLAAPELARRRAYAAHAPDRTRRPVSSSRSHAVSFTRGRPSGSPAARSAASIACQPSYSTNSAPFSPRTSPRSRGEAAWSLPPRASASSSSTVSVASFLFVPITPHGPRLIQPAQ